MDLVSVLITTYNREQFIKGAIDTVFNQSHQCVELVIVDDASTDKTKEILAEYSDCKNTKIIMNEENRGIARCRNIAFEHAKGEFICILDDDDRWNENKIELQFNKIKKLGEEYGLIYCGGKRKVDGNTRIHFQPKKRGKLYPEILADWGLDPHSGFFIRSSAFKNVGGYDESLPIAEDWDLSIRLAKEYKIGYVDEPLVIQQMHGDNVSAKTRNPTPHSVIKNKYWDEICQYPKVKDQFVANAKYFDGLRAQKLGNQGKAIKSFMSSFKTKRSVKSAKMIPVSVLGPEKFQILVKLRDKILSTWLFYIRSRSSVDWRN